MAENWIRIDIKSTKPKRVPSRKERNRTMNDAAAAGSRSRGEPRSAIAITGANRGIGLATARQVAAAGHPVILLCRSERRGREAADSLPAPEAGAPPHQVVEADIASFDSVRRAAARIADLSYPVGGLVNNAAVFPHRRTESPDGFELQLAVNHLGHFLLANLLFPLMDRTDSGAGPARVVAVSSGAHEGPAFDFDDPNFERKPYTARAAYQQSKLANVLFAHGLARRAAQSSVQAVALGPGVYRTQLLREYLAEGPFSGSVSQFSAAEKAGPVVAALAIGHAGEDLNGAYFYIRERTSPAPAAQDESAQERLWAWSAAATGCDHFAHHARSTKDPAHA